MTTPRDNARIDPRVVRSRATTLRATLDLLLEHGLAGTTIDAVAERSGVAKTTIYRHWPDRAALVLDAFDSILTPPPEPDTGVLRDDLVILAVGLANALSTSPAATLLPMIIDAAGRDPAFAALHRREAHRRHLVILNVINRGIDRGELPAGTDPAEVLDLLAGPLFHRRMLSQTNPTTEFAQRLVDVILHAYTGKAPQEDEPEPGPPLPT